MLEEIDPSTIEDPTLRQQFIKVLDALEAALARISGLEKENQRLKDDNNQLKGGSPKPQLLAKKGNYARPKKKADPKKKTRARASKQAKLVVTRTEELLLAKAALPKDAQFKGFVTVLVQDISFKAEVIRFKKAKYYSAIERQTYTAPLPTGYDGQFGPGVKALSQYLYYECHLSQPKIIELLSTFELELSQTELSSWLIREYAELAEAEAHSIVEAGLKSTPHQHIDQTGTRAIGQNWACHILCNLYYTAYFTVAGRDRLSVLGVLMGGAALKFRYTSEAARLLEQFGLGQKWRTALTELDQEQWFERTELEEWLSSHLKGLGKQSRKVILDALAIGAYQSQREWPIVKTLVCDDAPQFNHLTAQLMLCWLHEGRHYALLEPRLDYHLRLWQAFLARFWNFYDQLLAYTQNPLPYKKAWLWQEFDRLFTKSGEYQQLDAQLELTQAKKAQLLLVLEEPSLPLHNNPAELGARQRVRKLDVSLALASKVGLLAWDSFQTMAATAKKLGVNFYHYLYDRISGKLALPSLAALIGQKAEEARSYYPSQKALLQSHKRRAEKVRNQAWKKEAAKAQAPPVHKATSLKLTAPAPGLATR